MSKQSGEKEVNGLALADHSLHFRHVFPRHHHPSLSEQTPLRDIGAQLELLLHGAEARVHVRLERGSGGRGAGWLQTGASGPERSLWTACLLCAQWEKKTNWIRMNKAN